MKPASPRSSAPYPQVVHRHPWMSTAGVKHSSPGVSPGGSPLPTGGKYSAERGEVCFLQTVLEPPKNQGQRRQRPTDKMSAVTLDELLMTMASQLRATG